MRPRVNWLALCLLLLSVSAGAPFLAAGPALTAGPAPASEPASADKLAPGEPFKLHVFADTRRAAAESLVTLSEYELPPLRDMALNRGGDFLLLTRGSELLTLAQGDSLVLASFGADLGAGVWPEAVASDGADWLLLAGQGRLLLRLGRRGEALERMQIPEQDIYWRDLAADRSGRIWLAELSGGRFAFLSRGGQALQLWNLEERLPGFTGPVREWCPDEEGGLWVAAGAPLALHHLNGAGNVLASFRPKLGAGEPALAVDEDGSLLVSLSPAGSAPRLFGRPLSREIFYFTGDTLLILQRPGKGP